MKIGFLFPGQGSQFVGMGKDLYEKYDEVKNIYDKACCITGIDICDLSFNDPDGKLNETKYTQLAILVNSISILEVLKKNGITSYASCGLSLGEYSALINSGCLSIDDGIALVKKRGAFMQDLIPNDKYLMAAILGLEDSEVESVCRSIDGDVYPANYNCHGQVVISGIEEYVTKAIEIFKEKGAKAMPLKTSGPFHTKLLVKSRDALNNELKNIKFNNFSSKVVKNLDGTYYSDNDDMVEILSNHIVNSVQFTKSVETMLNDGVNTFVEIGPGKTLTNLVKKIAREKNIEVNLINISDCNSLENAITLIKGE